PSSTRLGTLASRASSSPLIRPASASASLTSAERLLALAKSSSRSSEGAFDTDLPTLFCSALSVSKRVSAERCPASSSSNRSAMEGRSEERRVGKGGGEQQGWW